MNKLLRLAALFLCALVLRADDPVFPGVILVPQIVVVKSDSRLLRDQGLPGRDPAIFVYIETKDADAKAYLISLRYSWHGTVFAKTVTVPVIAGVEYAYQAYAVFDIPDMGARVLGLTVELAEAPVN